MSDAKQFLKKPMNIGGYDFYQLTVNDHLALQDETKDDENPRGVDLTEIMLTGAGTEKLAKMFNARILRLIFHRSLKKGNPELTLEEAGEVALKGKELGEALGYILHGMTPDELKEQQAGGSGNE